MRLPYRISASPTGMLKTRLYPTLCAEPIRGDGHKRVINTHGTNMAPRSRCQRIPPPTYTPSS
eukprot:6187005-Pleurochrysis_carterae.AAC.1